MSVEAADVVGSDNQLPTGDSLLPDRASTGGGSRTRFLVPEQHAQRSSSGTSFNKGKNSS